MDIANIPHRRYNPLTDSWVLVSPHRNKRPWQGQVEKLSLATRPAHDPDCFLCPGNKRSNGETNPDYKNVYSFVNDFSALLTDTLSELDHTNELFKAESISGKCKVICFSPRHDLTIPQMDLPDIEKVIDLFVAEYQQLGAEESINYVQIFENKGAVMGCSNPHPHAQIWASSNIPDEPYKKQINQKKYFDRYQRTLLVDYVSQELVKNERIVCQNEHFVALVPFWATWPFETMIVPKRSMASIADLNNEEKTAFAAIYKQVTLAYDQLFEVSFPYSAGIHQAPTDGQQHPEWHWHMVFYPPLLRSATVKKFMVGYEMLANPQRDITAEQAALQLKLLVV